MSTSILPPWQSMENAPKDRVILTNEGTSCYVDRRNWGSPVTNGWHLCFSCGNIPSCADEGMSVVSIQPTKWMELPR
ncbi:hypothetical protein RYA05_03855 [Pseudomonas syringae pv. actinidiae]|nr:hypothetical protein [Pseudomonas syringae pv. actinidiae]